MQPAHRLTKNTDTEKQISKQSRRQMQTQTPLHINCKPAPGSYLFSETKQISLIKQR